MAGPIRIGTAISACVRLPGAMTTHLGSTTAGVCILHQRRVSLRLVSRNNQRQLLHWPRGLEGIRSSNSTARTATGHSGQLGAAGSVRGQTHSRPAGDSRGRPEQPRRRTHRPTSTNPACGRLGRRAATAGSHRGRPASEGLKPEPLPRAPAGDEPRRSGGSPRRRAGSQSVGPRQRGRHSRAGTRRREHQASRPEC